MKLAQLKRSRRDYHHVVTYLIQLLTLVFITKNRARHIEHFFASVTVSFGPNNARAQQLNNKKLNGIQLIEF